MINKEKSCCFTGHRIEKLPWRGNEQDERCIRLKEEISDAVEAAYSAGIRHFICGMATGCDMYFCEAAAALRNYHDDITIEAAIPCEEQAQRWPQELRRRYNELVVACDFYTLVQQHYTPECLMKRNRYMVDSSSLLIAAYNGRQGGTQSTMLYAIRQGLEIIELSVPE